jgi:triose/dihydroxyacetone kinase / FAD-AMP lyase (cyclizing)
MNLRGASDCLSKTALRSMGGTSGALYAIFFSAAAHALDSVTADSAGPSDYARALRSGCEAVKLHGGAKVGDRSMVDAMEPAADAAAQCSLGPHSCSSISDALVFFMSLFIE